MSDHSPQDPLLGAHLGSSEIERPLGAGGMSAVYLARQERPRRLVAIKVLRPQLAPGRDQWPVFLARFRREADAMAALDHANITPIYEFGERKDLAYLVMPFLPDGSLASLLDRQGPLPVERVVMCVEQVAGALDYAHQHGIIHRDVKPSNVLLHPDGRLLLSDFGIARPLDQRDLPGTAQPDADGEGNLTMVGAALGTPDFMAPEQILGDPVSPATDVYALGALAYTLLAGYTPFGGGGAQQTLERSLREAPQPLRLDRPDIPQRVEEALFWALAKDPADRPRSAGALARALRAGLRTGPLAAGVALWRRAAAPGASLSVLGGSSGHGEPASAAPRSAPGAAGPVLQGPVDLTRMEPSGPNAATLYDARFAGPFPPGGGVSAAGRPVWPARSAAGRASGPQRAPRLSLPLAAAVLGALIVLVVMAVTVGSLLGGANPFNGLTGFGLGAAPTATTRQSPTATPSPTLTPSPTPPANWLSVNPDLARLGCKSSKASASVQLSNAGPTALGWYERPESLIPGVSVRPTSGTLPPGHSVTITITNTDLFFSHDGSIDFIPTSPDAGKSAVLSYSASCGG